MQSSNAKSRFEEKWFFCMPVIWAVCFALLKMYLPQVNPPASGAPFPVFASSAVPWDCRKLVIRFLGVCIDFSFCSVTDIPLTADGKPNLAYTSQIHYLALASFSVAILMDVFSNTQSESAAKARMARLLFIVNGLAFTTYLLLRFNIAPVHFDFGGRPLMSARYLQWSCSTPTLILIISRMSLQPSNPISTIIFQIAVILAGFFASFLHPPFNLVFLVISFVCLLVVFYDMYFMFEEGIQGAMHPDDEFRIRMLRLVTYVVWSVFPLNWVLSACNWVSIRTEEIVYVACDMSAKLLFSLVLVTSHFMSVDRLLLLAMHGGDSDAEHRYGQEKSGKVWQ